MHPYPVLSLHQSYCQTITLAKLAISTAKLKPNSCPHSSICDALWNYTCSTTQMRKKWTLDNPDLVGHILLWTYSLVFFLLDGLCSTQSTSTAGSDETDLASSRRIPPDGWGFANVLMVTTTEGMLNRLNTQFRQVRAEAHKPVYSFLNHWQNCHQLYYSNQSVYSGNTDRFNETWRITQYTK